MIRPFLPSDENSLRKIHEANGLPAQCFPDLKDPLTIHTGVVVIDGKVVMSCSIRGTAELFLLVDHEAGTPEERWQWMVDLRQHIVDEAWARGLDDISAWVPPEIEESFGKRLEEMGFVRSPWSCYTLRLKK